MRFAAIDAIVSLQVGHKIAGRLIEDMIVTLLQVSLAKALFESASLFINASKLYGN